MATTESGFVYFTTGLTLYLKLYPHTVSPWSTGVIAMDGADTDGIYTFSALDTTLNYTLYEQLGGSPASTDTIRGIARARWLHEDLQDGGRLDLLFDIAASGAGVPSLLVSTTIATLASQTSFTLTAGSADDDAYNGSMIVITDVATSTQKAVGVVLDYVGSTKTVTLLSDPGIFTMAATDLVSIIATRVLSTGSGGSVLTVTLSDDSASLVSGSVVNVQTTGGVNIGAAQTTDEFGIANIPALLTVPDGDYLLKVSDRSGYDAHVAEAVTVSGATAKAITVTVATGSPTGVGWIDG